MRTLHRPIALLVLLLAVCSAVLFAFPVLTLYDSQWLPGFLTALTGSTLGVFFLLPYRRQSILYAVSLYAAPVVLVLYCLLLMCLSSTYSAPDRQTIFPPESTPIEAARNIVFIFSKNMLPTT